MNKHQGAHMTTMQAARIHRFGGPDVIRIESISIPEPGPGEILVRVMGAGINPVDFKIREGLFPAVGEAQLPLTLGREMAGTVERLGKGVTGLQLGDKVFGMIGADGGYAEYAVIKAQHVTIIPTGLDWIMAAAVPLAAHTAWQALFDHGKLERGQRVLIHGGSGGVGHFAIQLARECGAVVFTTGSEKSAGFLQSFGIDRFIDYKTEKFEEVCTDLDLVIDLIAGDTQQRSWGVLREGGTMVSTLGEPERKTPEAKGKQGIGFMAQPNGDQLADIAALITKGSVRPIVSRTFPLAKAAEAQHYLEREHVDGKIVLALSN
ncbi:NADP-dependent oxidoreductase [Pseudomonas luteola]|nr:NADP-dependent oxidoreductase [Pseudomonas zeshuii]